MAFIHVRNAVTHGEADIPEDSLTYWASKGFEPYDPPLPEEIAEIADEASLAMKRSELDLLADQAGVPDPETLPSKQAVLDAITDMSTSIPASPDPIQEN